MAIRPSRLLIVAVILIWIVACSRSSTMLCSEWGIMAKVPNFETILHDMEQDLAETRKRIRYQQDRQEMLQELVDATSRAVGDLARAYAAMARTGVDTHG